MDKKNVFMKAETGSGKTLAFLMPILFNVSRQVALSMDDADDGWCHPRCIVLAPTRELATQVLYMIYSYVLDLSSWFQVDEGF